MEMQASPCGRDLLLNIMKPRLELWDLHKVPQPACIQTFTGYQQEHHILIPGFSGINQSFIICGSEANGDDAGIYIWKRETGKLLAKIKGSCSNSSYLGHRNMINQVDGSLSNPHLFISCSDDHNVKVWGVKDLVSVSINKSSLKANSKLSGVKMLNVKDEDKGKSASRY
mmetsp:Transcript_16453/g.27924  ORF Transcript_16453/g.27924 Transcript_16453/m.27924 type:complete len:170 (-) Transcript_16453:466-975(-)